MKGIYGLMQVKLMITILTLCTDGKFTVETNFDFESHEAGCPDAAIKLPALTNVFCFTRT